MTARTPRPPRIPRGRAEHGKEAKALAGAGHDQVVAEPATPELATGVANLPTRAKTTRITVDLDPDDYELLGRYIAELTPEFRRLTIARTLRAMIRAAPGDYKVTAAITAQLRRDAS